MSLVDTIIGGASRVVGGLLGLSGQQSANRANLRAVQETNEANRRLTERQYQMAQEFWRMNNEYNIPSNQMQRLKDAGLNPNLVYGNGTVVGNSSSMPSVPNAIPQQAFTGNKNELSPLGDSFSGLVGSISQLETMSTQRELIKKDIEGKGADIDLRKSQKVHQDIENEILGNNAVAEGKMSQARLDHIEKQNRNLDSENDLTRQRINNELINANIMAEEAEKLTAEIDYLVKKKELIPLEADKLRVQIRESNASINHINQLAHNADLTGQKLSNDLIYNDLKNIVEIYENIYKTLYPNQSVYGRVVNDVLRLVERNRGGQVAVTDALIKLLKSKGYEVVE